MCTVLLGFHVQDFHITLNSRLYYIVDMDKWRPNGQVVICVILLSTVVASNYYEIKKDSQFSDEQNIFSYISMWCKILE